MTSFELYQVDAFVTEALFSGNPAAVCPLDAFLDDATLQAVAASNNLSETAYLVAKGPGLFDLRWMTPSVEVDLCGHATLASAHVAFTRLGVSGEEVGFDTRSGRLTVRRGSVPTGYVMDFPSHPGVPGEPPTGLVDAVGGAPSAAFLLPSLHAAPCWMLVYSDAQAVAALRPDFKRLGGIANVLVTAPGAAQGIDFVTRFFCPDSGIDEDPVTGSAYTWATPYWAARLGRETLKARQISARGGAIDLKLNGARVEIGGVCRDYLEGRVTLA